MADGVWSAMYQETKAHPEDRLYRNSKVGTGLTRPDYRVFVDGFIATLNPNHITDAIIMFGANDDEGLRDDNHKGHAYDSPGWIDAYQARMMMIITACRQRHITVVWLGLPVMRDAARNRDALLLNAVLQRTVQSSGAVFLPLEDDFKGKDGAFSLYLPDQTGRLRLVRAEDGTHFAFYGYDLIAKKAYAVVRTPTLSLPTAQK